MLKSFNKNTTFFENFQIFFYLLNNKLILNAESLSFNQVLSGISFLQKDSPTIPISRSSDFRKKNATSLTPFDLNE